MDHIGIDVPSGSAEGFLHRVRALALPGRLVSTIAPLLAVMRHLNQQLAYSEETIERVSAHDERVQRRRTVPNVGPVTAAAFVATLDDAQRFRHAHHDRVFTQCVGAPATAVARTRRVQLAKTLLDATEMSIAEVAFAAGFSSVRRFNAVFSETYRRPPSAVRRSSPSTPVGSGSMRLRLTYCPPFDWPALVRLLGAESTPGVEEVRGARRGEEARGLSANF